ADKGETHRKSAPRAEPVSYYQRTGQQRRCADADAKQHIGAEQRAEGIDAARDQKTAGGHDNAGDHHDSRLDFIEQPSDEWGAEPGGKRQRGALKRRELRAFPSEMFQQMREKQTASVVTGAEHQQQRDEQACDDHPSLAFSLRNRTSSSPEL